MPIELGPRLIAAGLVVPEEVEAALFLSVLRGIPFTRALIDRGAITERDLKAAALAMDRHLHSVEANLLRLRQAAE